MARRGLACLACRHSARHHRLGLPVRRAQAVQQLLVHALQGAQRGGSRGWRGRGASRVPRFPIISLQALGRHGKAFRGSVRPLRSPLESAARECLGLACGPTWSGACRSYRPPLPAAASRARHSASTPSRSPAAAASAAPASPCRCLRRFLGEPTEPRSGRAGHLSSQASDTACSICRRTRAGFTLAAPSRLAATRWATSPRCAPQTAPRHRSRLPACSPASAAGRAASAGKPNPAPSPGAPPPQPPPPLLTDAQPSWPHCPRLRAAAAAGPSATSTDWA